MEPLDIKSVQRWWVWPGPPTSAASASILFVTETLRKRKTFNVSIDCWCAWNCMQIMDNDIYTFSHIAGAQTALMQFNRKLLNNSNHKMRNNNNKLSDRSVNLRKNPFSHAMARAKRCTSTPVHTDATTTAAAVGRVMTMMMCLISLSQSVGLYASIFILCTQNLIGFWPQQMNFGHTDATSIDWMCNLNVCMWLVSNYNITHTRARAQNV